MSATFRISSLRQRAFTVLVTLLVLATGCNSKKPAENAAPENDKVSLFKEGKGILFSVETKKLFGLEIAEVTEKPMPRRLRKTAQVYRPGREGIPASAMLLLSAEEAKELKVGQPVKLKAGDAPEICGTLVLLDPQAHTVLAQIEALVEFADPHQLLPGGAFVTATLINGETRRVFVAPESALLTTADGSYVYTVNSAHLIRTRVKPGAVIDGFVEIEDGLYAGDSVAAKGVDGLWLVELSALKGGTPCCPVPKKKAEK
jgi:multidrug efflux pump subunit AcrA (membrane-fusion protein)